MKIYYAPEFARQVEQASTRHQNMVKFISGFFEHSDLAKIIGHPRLVVKLSHAPDMYRISLEELSIFASLVRDAHGEYWIFAQLNSS